MCGRVTASGNGWFALAGWNSSAADLHIECPGLMAPAVDAVVQVTGIAGLNLSGKPGAVSSARRERGYRVFGPMTKSLLLAVLLMVLVLPAMAGLHITETPLVVEVRDQKNPIVFEPRVVFEDYRAMVCIRPVLYDFRTITVVPYDE